MLLLCCSWRGLLLRLALLVVMVLLLLLPLVCRQSLFTIFLLEHAQAPAVIRVVRSRITC